MNKVMIITFSVLSIVMRVLCMTGSGAVNTSETPPKLTVERGLLSSPATLSMQLYTLPIALSTV